jgi:hypothetical protein
MKVITPGHRYELMPFEPPKTVYEVQQLQFIEKVPTQPGSTELETKNNGTTNEEVLEVLINRLQFLQEKFPCRENAIVITKLQECLFWLNYRTKLRQQQNVEGAQLTHKEA